MIEANSQELRWVLGKILTDTSGWGLQQMDLEPPRYTTVPRSFEAVKAALAELVESGIVISKTRQEGTAGFQITRYMIADEAKIELSL